MAPIEQSDAAVVRFCAGRAWRGLSPSLTRDDLLQIGHIAAWLARRDGRVPEDQLHARRYLVKRVLGAMIDANREAWRQWPMTIDEFGDEHETAAPNQPEVMLQLRQAVARINRLGSSRMTRSMALLADGCTCAEAAGIMGVDPSRVSQLRREARRIVADCF